MTLIRSVIFTIVFYVWTAILTLTTGLTLPFPPTAARAVGRFWARSSNFLLRAICGVRTEIRGLEDVPKGPLLVASKHQSAWDTFIFLPLLDYPVYVLKEELLRVPLFGPCLRKMGHVGIDRGAGASAMRTLVERTGKALAKDRQVIIFPEGTRSEPGASGRYHPGIAALYSRLDAACLPVALNSGMHWGRKSWIKRPGTIVLELLPVIEPGLDRRAFQEELAERIETASLRLWEEDGGRAPVAEPAES